MTKKLEKFYDRLADLECDLFCIQLDISNLIIELTQKVSQQTLLKNTIKDLHNQMEMPKRRDTGDLLPYWFLDDNRFE